MKDQLVNARSQVITALKVFILALTVMFSTVARALKYSITTIDIENTPEVVIGFAMVVAEVMAFGSLIKILSGALRAAFQPRVSRPTALEYRLRKETVGLSFLVVPAFVAVLLVTFTIANGFPRLSRYGWNLIGGSLLSLLVCGAFFYRGRRPPEHVLKQW